MFFPNQRLPGLFGAEPEIPLDPRLAGGPPQIQGGLMRPRGLDTLQTAPPTPARPPVLTFRERIGQLWAGAYDPRLSAEENALAQKRALFMSGLAMLSNVSSGKGTIANLGESLMYGHQMGEQSRAGSYAQRTADDERAEKERLKKNRARVEELVRSAGDSINPQMMRQLFVETIAAGDTDSARSLAQVLQVMEGQQGRRDPVNWTTFDSGGLKYERDPETGRTRPLMSPDEKTQMKADPPFGLSQVPRLVENELFNRHREMANDFRQEIKPFEDTYHTIIGTLENVPLALKGDGAAQNELVVTFVRALDPTSVAREGEVALARAAAAIWDQVQGFYKKWAQGEGFILPPGLAKQMANLIDLRAQGYERRWNSLRDDFVERGVDFGVKASNFRAPPKRRKLSEILGGSDDSDPFAKLPVRR